MIQIIVRPQQEKIRSRQPRTSLVKDGTGHVFMLTTSSTPLFAYLQTQIADETAKRNK